MVRQVGAGAEPGPLRAERTGFPAAPQLPVPLLRGPHPFHHFFPHSLVWFSSPPLPGESSV